MAQREALPKCDGSNGILGLDCESVRGYPRKTEGRPWGPMNDAYPEDYPRYASRAQVEGPKCNYPIIDATTLPVCNGTNGIPNLNCWPSNGPPTQHPPTTLV